MKTIALISALFYSLIISSQAMAQAVDFEDLQKKTYDNLISSFLKELNDKNSIIRIIIEDLREQNRDGRNMSGGFPEDFTQDDLKLFMMGQSENQRIRCGSDTNGNLECDGRSFELTYLVSVPQTMCHNSGCDVYTDAIMYKVTSTMIETCKGTWDQDPWEDSICSQTFSVQEFETVSIQ
jgi:hypothetical protein